MKLCANRRYVDESEAKRVLWAMKQNRRSYADDLTPKPCKLCKGWHLVRK